MKLIALPGGAYVNPDLVTHVLPAHMGDDHGYAAIYVCGSDKARVVVNMVPRDVAELLGTLQGATHEI